MPLRSQLCAIGGLVGPGVFIVTWLLLGLAAVDYSPKADAISELARIGRPSNEWMAFGFSTFAIGITVFAIALRRGLGGRAWIAALVTAVASAGVAITPLGSAMEPAHFFAAGIAYVSLITMPIVAAASLTGVRKSASYAIGATSAACLVASVVGPQSFDGLLQRSGLTVGDAWIVGMSIELLRKGRPSRHDRMMQS